MFNLLPLPLQASIPLSFDPWLESLTNSTLVQNGFLIQSVSLTLYCLSIIVNNWSHWIFVDMCSTFICVLVSKFSTKGQDILRTAGVDMKSPGPIKSSMASPSERDQVFDVAAHPACCSDWKHIKEVKKYSPSRHIWFFLIPPHLISISFDVFLTLTLVGHLLFSL